MEKFDAVIVGAGLGGLTCGALLASEGKKVAIVEQHSIPGGCATVFKRKGFTIEVGLHEMDGLDNPEDMKREIFEKLDIRKNVEFIKAPEFYKTIRGDDVFVFPDGYEESIKALVERFPEEEKAIRKYYDFIFKMRKEINRWPRTKWKQLLMLPLAPFLFPKLLTNLKSTAGQLVDRLTDNEDLKMILMANVQYYHDEPSTMSLFYFVAAQTSYISGGGHYIKGGSQNLSNYLASFIEERGGKMIYKSLVTEIIEENGKATGIKYHPVSAPEELSTISADVVIANAAAPTIVPMLPTPVAEKYAKKIQRFSNSPSILTLYLCFDRDLKEFGSDAYSTFIMDKSLQRIDQLKGNFHGDISVRNMVFVDYGRIDSGLAPDGKSLGVVCAADFIDDWKDLSKEEYAAKKEHYTQEILKRLEEVYPGISDAIVYKELATAKTVQRYTLNPGGAVYGFAQIPSQAGPLRQQVKGPLKDLFISSVWTLPGGGFSGAMLAGRNCFETVLKRLNKNG